MKGLGYRVGLYTAGKLTCYRRTWRPARSVEAGKYKIRGMLLKSSSDYSMKTGLEGRQA